MRLDRDIRLTIVFLVLATAGSHAYGVVAVLDDTGHHITLSRPARRVVSLAPSTTEMLFAIGAQATVVGVSSADNFPPAARALPKMGSFSGPDLERIAAARPDLVIAAYGNPLAVLERLRRLNIPVYVSNPTAVAGVWRDMGDLGTLTGRRATADRVVREQQNRVRRVAARLRGQLPVKTLVVIWDAPLTVAGGKSFIQDILRLAGGANAAAGLATAYPTLDPERLALLDPAVVIFPVAGDSTAVERLKREPGFRLTSAARSDRFYTLNPDWLMRPGPRVVDGVEAVARVLHPLASTHQASH